MMVKLTRNQWHELAGVAEPVHIRWLDKANVASERVVEVTMPPVGWRTLADLAMAEAFTPYGYRARNSGVVGGGLKRIARGLSEVEAHPAFVGQAMPGWHFHWFMAWGSNPYPDPEFEASILAPDRIWANAQPITVWERIYPIKTNRDPLLVPGEHWAFIRQGGSPT